MTLRRILCVILGLLLAAGDAFAWRPSAGDDTESDRARWQKVRDIGPDKQVEVETRLPDASSSIRTYRGRLLRWEPEGLLLALRKGGDREIAKSLVRNVRVKEKGNRGKAAAIGGAIGFGAGMGVGVAAFGSLDKHGGTGQQIGLGALFGLIFGGVGALLGSVAGGTRMTTVYHR